MRKSHSQPASPRPSRQDAPPLSPESEVEARYDGRIPKGALEAARRGPAPVTRLPPAAKRAWLRGGCLQRMAERIAADVAARGVATREDLRRAGFTAEEIERHGDEAVALAAGRLLTDDGDALDRGC